MRGDGARAAALMLAHLTEVEEGLDMSRAAKADVDLADALAIRQRQPFSTQPLP